MVGLIHALLAGSPASLVLMGVLFAAGTGGGVAGVVLARSRPAIGRALAWLAIGTATLCTTVGVTSMLLVQSRSPSSSLERGMKASDLQRLRSSADDEARACLAAGLLLGSLPFLAGVLAVARARQRTGA